jgi:hypothetical protein
MSTYTGTCISELIETADSVRDPLSILHSAFKHLCDRSMTAGEVQACFLIGELQEKELCRRILHVHEEVKRRVIRCQAAEGPDAVQCGRVSAPGEMFCREHLQEWD